LLLLETQLFFGLFKFLLLLEHLLFCFQLGLLALDFLQFALGLLDLSHLLGSEFLLKFLLFFLLESLLFCDETLLLGQLSFVLTFDSLKLLQSLLLGERKLVLIARIDFLDDLLLFLLLLFARRSPLLTVIIAYLIHLHLEL
jgi:hypothetical protein